MSLSLQDFLATVDFTGYGSIAGSLLDNGFATLTPNPDANPLQGIGVVLVTIDTSQNIPAVPDPTASIDYAKWKRYVWLRIPYSTDTARPTIYAWVDTIASVPTYLKWQPAAIDLTTIENEIAALQTGVTTALAAANTANTNSTNALNQATAAVTVANNASNTANTAVATANGAVTSATIANTTAAGAVTTAGQAVTTANTANATANAAATTVNNAALGIAGAWGNFNFAGSAVTPGQYNNVASVVHTGTGIFTITFTTPFKVGNISTIVTVQDIGNVLVGCLSSTDTGSSSEVIISTRNATSGAFTDPQGHVNFVCFGSH